MKLVKTASGKHNVKISKSEWQAIGKKAGWMKTASITDVFDKYPRMDIGSAYSMLWDIINNNSIETDFYRWGSLTQEQIDKVPYIATSDFYRPLFSDLIGYDIKLIHNALEEERNNYRSNREYEPEHRHLGT